MKKILVTLRIEQPNEFFLMPNGIFNRDDPPSKNFFLFLLKNFLEEEFTAKSPSSPLSIDKLELEYEEENFDFQFLGYLTLQLYFHNSTLPELGLEEITSRILDNSFYNFWDTLNSGLTLEGLSIFLKITAKIDPAFTFNETFNVVNKLHSTIQDLQKYLDYFQVFLIEIPSVPTTTEQKTKENITKVLKKLVGVMEAYIDDLAGIDPETFVDMAFWSVIDNFESEVNQTLETLSIDVSLEELVKFLQKAGFTISEGNQQPYKATLQRENGTAYFEPIKDKESGRQQWRGSIVHLEH